MTQEAALYTMQSGVNVFLTGAPGAGKTYVLNQYLGHLKKYGIDAAITAPTGIAASHIGGMTLHSFFGIGIRESLSAYDIEALTEKKYLWDRMKNLKVLVIDEVSMLSPGLFSTIDQILKTFKFSTEPFGGVQVILVGDFFQLPPISRNYVDASKRFIFQTETWKQLNPGVCYLNTSYRHEDETLLAILNEIRSGSVSSDSMTHFRGRYNKTIEGASSVTKLYTHNMDVDAINTKALAEIDSPPKVYEAHTTGAKKWLEKIFGSSLVLPDLKLKKGALVFFIKNNYEKKYINGTLGTVVDFDTFGTPIVETHDGRTIKAERREWVFADSDGKPKATVKQIPLRLAWAITVHKSQGMTLDAAEIDLSKAFEPGQGYVALSRIKSLDGLRLMGLNDMALAIDPHVLKTDCEMQDHSDEIYSNFNTLSDEEKQHRVKHYMEYLGGSVEQGDEKKETAKKAKKPKTKSFLESKKYFESHMTIAEIADERDMAEATIMGHLRDILNDDPEFDITYLQPDYDIIDAVETAVTNIRARKNKTDFSEKGEIRLKPIYLELDGAVEYDEIKLALLFL